jgi:hypothetical protein
VVGRVELEEELRIADVDKRELRDEELELVVDSTVGVGILEVGILEGKSRAVVVVVVHAWPQQLLRLPQRQDILVRIEPRHTQHFRIASPSSREWPSLCDVLVLVDVAVVVAVAVALATMELLPTLLYWRPWWWR